MENSPICRNHQHTQTTKESKKKPQKKLENIVNENKITVYHNFGEAAKALLRRKCISVKAYIKKEQRFQLMTKLTKNIIIAT